MGANLSYRSYLASRGKEQIEKLWNDAVEHSLYEDGHSYSGEIGMLGSKISQWHDLKLPHSHHALDYLETNHKKWKPAIAVSYYTDNGKDLVWMIGGWCSS